MQSIVGCLFPSAQLMFDLMYGFGMLALGGAVGAFVDWLLF